MRALLTPIFLTLATATGSLRGLTLEEFRALPDHRVAVRTSFGVRSAHAVSASRVELVIGLSVTEAAGKPEAYRILSFEDEAYVYEKFIRPLRAEVRRGRDAAHHG
jgi:hypothetical protein